MPTEEIPTLNSEQKEKIVKKSTNVRYMNKNINPENSPIIYEICLDFAKTMNKIVFNKHLNTSGKELILSKLTLPPAPPPKKVDRYAMIQIPRHDFSDQFSNFCFKSLYIKEEVVISLEKIKDQCLSASEKEIFNINFTKTMRLEEFRQIEMGAISQVALYLNAWKDNINSIISVAFQDMGKG